MVVDEVPKENVGLVGVFVGDSSRVGVSLTGLGVAPNEKGVLRAVLPGGRVDGVVDPPNEKVGFSGDSSVLVGAVDDTAGTEFRGPKENVAVGLDSLAGSAGLGTDFPQSKVAGFFSSVADAGIVKGKAGGFGFPSDSSGLDAGLPQSKTVDLFSSVAGGAVKEKVADLGTVEGVLFDGAGALDGLVKNELRGFGGSVTTTAGGGDFGFSVGAPKRDEDVEIPDAEVSAFAESGGLSQEKI